MAIELRRARSLPGIMVILHLLLLLLFLCTTSSTGTVTEVQIHDYKNSSFMQNIYLSEWGLESENGRRLLQTPQYISYGVLQPDIPAGSRSIPGQAYSRGCQASHYCRDQ